MQQRCLDVMSWLPKHEATTTRIAAEASGTLCTLPILSRTLRTLQSLAARGIVKDLGRSFPDGGRRWRIVDEAAAEAAIETLRVLSERGGIEPEENSGQAGKSADG